MVKLMETKHFKMVDESFLCENCLAEVKPLKKTARDHCNKCLYSKHVDVFPGDRKNGCRGLLKPIAIEKFKDTYKIIYRCEKCHEIHKNIIAEDDNFDGILKLMQNPTNY